MPWRKQDSFWRGPPDVCGAPRRKLGDNCCARAGRSLHVSPSACWGQQLPSTDCRHLVRWLTENSEHFQNDNFPYHLNSLYHSRHKLGTKFYMPQDYPKYATALPSTPCRALQPCLAEAARLPLCRANRRANFPPTCRPIPALFAPAPSSPAPQPNWPRPNRIH
jgi:hypothetical protein